MNGSILASLPEGQRLSTANKLSEMLKVSNTLEEARYLELPCVNTVIIVGIDSAPNYVTGPGRKDSLGIPT